MAGSSWFDCFHVNLTNSQYASVKLMCKKLEDVWNMLESNRFGSTSCGIVLVVLQCRQRGSIARRRVHEARELKGILLEQIEDQKLLLFFFLVFNDLYWCIKFHFIYSNFIIFYPKPVILRLFIHVDPCCFPISPVLWIHSIHCCLACFVIPLRHFKPSTALPQAAQEKAVPLRDLSCQGCARCHRSTSLSTYLPRIRIARRFRSFQNVSFMML